MVNPPSWKEVIRVTEPVLRTDGLKKHFGGIKAVDGVSIHVDEGEILSIIGPNGAGKTTLFNLLTGVYDATAGTVDFRPDEEWRDITDEPTHDITKLGVVRTFQNARPFSELTARQNVLTGLGADRYRSLSMFTRYEQEAAMTRADELLSRVGLSEYASALGGDLPLALQRRLEIARVLALDPRVILLDEPAAGLNEDESEELMALLSEFADDGLTVVLIEHAMDVVMGISHRIYVLDRGEIIAEGDPVAIQSNEQVKQAYLGETGVEAAEGWSNA